jgi:hypothetical protein
VPELYILIAIDIVIGYSIMNACLVSNNLRRGNNTTSGIENTEKRIVRRWENITENIIVSIERRMDIITKLFGRRIIVLK